MRKGGNTVLDAAQVEVGLRWLADSNTPDVDFLALLLNESGKVDTDEDLVFYNQPAHPNGKVRLGSRTAPPHASQTMLVDLAGLPAAVQRVLLVCAADGGDFGQVDRLHMVVLDKRGGTELVRFSLTGDGQSTLIAGELYRRQAAWKFRAVDQGYVSGLVGLAVDYGINVDANTAAAASPTRSMATGGTADGLTVHGGDPLEVSLSGLSNTESVPADLTLSALTYSARHELIDLVWLLHPVEFEGSIRLHQPTAGSTAPSRMTLNLQALPDDVSSIVLTASSFRRQRLSAFPELRLQLADPQGDLQHSVPLNTAEQNAPSVVIAVLSRNGQREWSLEPVLEYRTERCGLDLVGAGISVVRSLPPARD